MLNAPEFAMTKRSSAIACLLLIGAKPGICMADAGSLGGVLDGIIMLAEYVLGWSLVSIAVLLLLRWCKVSKAKRIVVTFLFWISPLFLLDPAVELYGEPGTHVTVQTEKPVIFAGATFPAGSRADYIHLGGGFWRRKLVEIGSTRPVKLGRWDITLAWPDPNIENVVRVHLARPEVIEGWACNIAPAFELTAGLPRLHACSTTTPRTIGDLVWPADTYAGRTEDGGWELGWSGYRQDPKAFGFPIRSMQATYNASFQLQTWTGLAEDDDDLMVGDYTFSHYGETHLTWSSNGEMRVEGYGKENKTSAARTICVRVRLQDRMTRPCSNTTEPQQAQRPEASPDSSQADDE